MENTNRVGAAVIVAVFLLIGIALLSQTADTVSLAQTTYTTVNESITLSTDGTAVSLANDWVTGVTAVVVFNGTQNASQTTNVTLTVTTNYTTTNLNSDTDGAIAAVSNDFNGNTTWVTYTYQDDNFVRHGTSRVLINLITIFFTLFILAMALWGMYRMGMFEFMTK